MRLSLKAKTSGGRDPEAFSGFPGLCCQAAGGQVVWADPLAAAWLMYYTAAHLMDSLEDQDDPDEWWAESGPGAALNVATGLFFSAGLALQELNRLPLDHRVTQETITLALQPFMRMSSGQYADFISPPQTLEEYWRIAAAKSGEFFALACRAGARLATSRAEALDGFEQYGMNAGLLVQVLDDLVEYRDLIRGAGSVEAKSLSASLPSLFIREVCPAPAAERFERLLSEPGERARPELVHLLEENGVGQYLMAELEMRRSLAQQGLEAGAPPGPARNALLELLHAI
jgi:competence protein ComQ